MATLLKTATLKPLPFRFEHADHTYWVGDQLVPNVTGMLKKTGWVDDSHYKEEHRVRGQAVHQLTSEYDLRSLDIDRLVSPYRGYVLGHVEVMKRLRPTWLAVEEPVVHPQFRFGCRPDRVMRAFKAVGLMDQKTGGPEKWHRIQLALQAIAVSWRYGLAPEAMQRFNEYLTVDGGGRMIEHLKRRDFDEAYRIIKECC
jgi:hypothetical protein